MFLPITNGSMLKLMIHLIHRHNPSQELQKEHLILKHLCFVTLVLSINKLFKIMLFSTMPKQDLLSKFLRKAFA